MSAPLGFSPARPPNERDIVQQINGQPNFLGVLTSIGAESEPGRGSVFHVRLAREAN